MRKRAFINKGFLFLVVLACFVVTFNLGYNLGAGKNILGTPNLKNINLGKPSDVDFSLYWEAWNKLKEKSVTSPDTQNMVYGSISGLLSSANDPYTVFFNPTENKRFKEDIQGEFDGIGVELIMKNNLPTVISPISGGPAEKAGIRAGDIIAEVDGIKASEMGFNEIINKIRGESGTTVELKIIREGKDEPLVLKVVREKIIMKSVEWKYEERNGKRFASVEIRQFGDDTEKLFDDFVNDVIKNKPDGLVIDLRNNPGGYLQTAIDLSSYFIDGGTVVIERNKDGRDKEYKVTKKARLKNFKTVVLVNKGSASASEIFAGALQDRDAGEIIGEKTFGKGSVQELIDLSDGSSVKITVAKWLTPSGRTINGDGIEPDQVVTDEQTEKEDDPVLVKGFEYLLGK